MAKGKVVDITSNSDLLKQKARERRLRRVAVRLAYFKRRRDRGLLTSDQRRKATRAAKRTEATA